MRRDLGTGSRGCRPQGLATWSRPWATSPGSAAPPSRGYATGIDAGVKEFLARSLDHIWFPHLFVDATHLNVRVGYRVVCQALGRSRNIFPGDAETTQI